MFEYKKINVITGWIVFAIATIVYVLTVEETASFWDCGEFIAVSYKLEVPHPPGAPFFLIIGRLFSFLAMGDTTQVAFWINMVSVLSSSFTILFMFWSITHIAKKLVAPDKDREDLSTADTLLIMASGVVGSLAYTFSDSFWFSAVEAEVYAMSSFFTAVVFWAILRWEDIENDSRANKWLIFIAYCIGLSIGVHLLNLLTAPAIALIIYFKKTKEVTLKGVLITLVASGLVILVVTYGIIPGLPSLAGSIEVFFVNSLRLPFLSGIVFIIALILGVIIYGIYYSHTKGIVWMNTAMLCLAFVLIGYASYGIILVRSGANPPIDENNPENIVSFVSYLKREQYGSRPLVHGQYFDAQVVEQKKGAPVYRRGKDKYEVADHKTEYSYDPKRTTILPRMYSSTPRHVEKYRAITGLKKGQKPDFADNIVYMLRHQLGHMYFRYFMWNFSGRESDIQNAGYLKVAEAFEKVPESIENNKARNKFYMIPLLLGIVGFVFQMFRDKKNFAVMGLLFLFLGVWLVFYLNSPPIEPRERDYIYVGSFYAFAFWIGFAVIAIYEGIKRVLNNKQIAIALAFLLSMVAPGIMAAEGWDDHDRSNRFFSVDAAKNYLNSCAPNAILFTGGDNDTFPLWYAQEVEGFRTDVRVIVLSYFNTDWYIEQMMRDAYESKPLPFNLPLEDYVQGGPNDYLPVQEKLKEPISATKFLKLLKNHDKRLSIPTTTGSYNAMPSKSLFLSVDTASVKGMGIVPERFQKYMVDKMKVNVKGRGLEKKDLAILDFIEANNWKRPIYFNNTSLAGVNFDLKKFTVQEGNTFRLMPVENSGGDSFINTDIMYDNVMNRSFWRELDNPNVYFGPDHRNFVLNSRSTFFTLVDNLMREGKKEKAKEVIVKCLNTIPDEAIEFDHFNVLLMGHMLELGMKEEADKMAEVTSKRAEEMLNYLFENEIADRFRLNRNLVVLNELSKAYNKIGDLENAKKYNEIFKQFYGK